MAEPVPAEMRALMLTGRGAVDVQDLPVPQPGAGEVLVRMAASPVNPSDLMTLQGAYGIAKEPPFVPGFEGSGIVVAAGPGLMGRLMTGRAVGCSAPGAGLWADYAVVPADACMPLPRDVPLGSGAMSAVNPLTAIALVAEARRGGHRVAVNTAAAGQLGRMIRKRGRAKGVRTIDIVRRPEQVAALKEEGARHVLDQSDPGFADGLAALCRDLRCRLAFDAVGGAMTGHLAEALCPRSDILVYGGLGTDPVTIETGTVIFREVTVRGFWLARWLPRKSLPTVLWMVREAGQALRGGFAVSEVARIVSLDEAAAGIAAYEQAMSAGKTLIRMNDADLGVTATEGRS